MGRRKREQDKVDGGFVSNAKYYLLGASLAVAMTGGGRAEDQVPDVSANAEPLPIAGPAVSGPD